jgi:heavy metal-binding protein
MIEHDLQKKWLVTFVFFTCCLSFGCYHTTSNKSARAPVVTKSESLRKKRTVYFCPMHPSIIRSEESKCPICSMPLSKVKGSTLQRWSDDELAMLEAQPSCPVCGDGISFLQTPIRIRQGALDALVCSKDCARKAVSNPDETSAAVQKIRAKHSKTVEKTGD